MIATQELEQLLANMESDRVERKSVATDPDKICQAICAFSNDLAGNKQPGVVFIGVNDDGSFSGLPITDDLMLKISGWRSNGQILPVPSMNVQKRVLNGAEVLVVEVQPSTIPPVRYKGVTWVRVGPSRAIASEQEEKFLAERRTAGNLPYDHQAIVVAATDDLDLGMFEREYLPNAVDRATLRASDRTLEQQLMALRLLTPELKPTVASILLLGKDPRAFLPGAYVQFLRISGTTLLDPVVDQLEISGPLSQMVRQLEDKLRSYITVDAQILGVDTEVKMQNYPLEAIQQVVRNALIHRSYDASNAPISVYWYDDRIEVHNPGGLYGQVTKQNYLQGVTDYRNPLVASGMKILGWVQRFGYGVDLTIAEMKRNGNPLPEFSFDNQYSLITLRRRMA